MKEGNCDSGVYTVYTLSFYNNLLYKNIEAEICEISRMFNNKPEAEILKRI